MKIKNFNMAERMAHFQVPGLSMALINNGQITTHLYGVLESGTQRKVGIDSQFSACSISKFITSMLALKLTDDCTLNLDEDVNNRLTTWKVPENKFTLHKKVTLRTLLSHQSGLADPKGSFESFDTTQGAPSTLELLNGTSLHSTAPVEVKFQPGSEFQYSDVNYFVVHQLIEDVTGNSFTELINELIFQPLNMIDSTYEPFNVEKNKVATGHNKSKKLDQLFPFHYYPASAGLWSTPSDIAKLVVELMNALWGESKIGLTQETAKEMITAQGCTQYAGLGVFIDDTGKEYEISSFGWGEGFQSMLVAYPYVGSGVVIMTNTNLGVHQLKGIIGEIYRFLEIIPKEATK